MNSDNLHTTRIDTRLSQKSFKFSDSKFPYIPHGFHQTIGKINRWHSILLSILSQCNWSGLILNILCNTMKVKFSQQFAINSQSSIELLISSTLLDRPELHDVSRRTAQRSRRINIFRCERRTSQLKRIKKFTFAQL